jgi:osmotically-inducible protein OsmY
MDGIRFDYPDEDLRFRVNRFLRSRHFPGFDDLEVAVDSGSVTLTGLLRSYYEKQVALSSCQRVAGVVTLVDRISVANRRRQLVG